MEKIDVTDLETVWIARGTEKRELDVAEVDGEFIAPPSAKVFAEEP